MGDDVRDERVDGAQPPRREGLFEAASSTSYKAVIGALATPTAGMNTDGHPPVPQTTVNAYSPPPCRLNCLHVNAALVRVYLCIFPRP
ncbi:uncharacterized protein UV8b_07566 [Ustilaginoidea virens]|uniref:Uncharacterized protein n=1 Tax=Ustilaginoidea virens TaxID=1159556 RepID=A0A8E5HXR0_USTVR|nr:uncharacterized protein UV8b_07566 [Ustilaginoidea virens]QUC23325.1 hypothetical protein UV8b_07566 [Ustilaginoidea virens]